MEEGSAARKVPPPPTPDELKARLQASLKRSRPHTHRVVTLAGVAVLGLLGLMAYLLLPGNPPPQPFLAALDAVSPADRTTVSLHLQLEERVEEDRRSPLQGQDIVVMDSPVPRPGVVVEPVRVKSGPRGLAAAEIAFTPTAGRGQYLGRLPGSERRSSVEDQGQVFFVPANEKLLLVQVQHCLTWLDAARWPAEPLLEIAPAAGAAQFLQEARRRGYQVVYVAADAERVSLHHKQRSWIRHGAADGKPPFPAGPVLGRPRYDVPDALPWTELLEDLKTRFPGRIEAVVGTTAAASRAREAGVPVRQVGAAEAVPGVPRHATWEEALASWKN